MSAVQSKVGISLPLWKPSYNIRKAVIFGSTPISKNAGILE